MSIMSTCIVSKTVSLESANRLCPRILAAFYSQLNSSDDALITDNRCAIMSPTSNSTLSANENCRTLIGDPSTVKAVKILAYCLVLIVSLLGNSAIISIVIRNKRMRTTVNCLIANMAASDLLISTVAVPMKLCEIAVGPRRWLIEGTLGLILCKLTYFLQDISTYVSIQSLVVIAIDRYRGIVFPFRPALITPKLCRVIIPLVWITSMSLHAPYFYTARLFSRHNKTICDFSWAPNFADHQRIQERYMMALFIIIVILPLCVITFLYSRIIFSLRKGIATRRRRLSSSCTNQRHKENAKVFKNIFAIWVAFVVCVIPALIYGILFYFVWKWKMPCNMEQLGFAVHFVLYSNAAVTPVVIFVFNDKYRQRLKDRCISGGKAITASIPLETRILL